MRRPVTSSRNGSSLAPASRRFTFISPWGFEGPATRSHARLLGPCSRRVETVHFLLAARFPSTAPLTKTSPHAAHGNGEPVRPESRSGLYRRQGGLSTPNRTVRPAAAAHASARPSGWQPERMRGQASLPRSDGTQTAEPWCAGQANGGEPPTARPTSPPTTDVPVEGVLLGSVPHGTVREQRPIDRGVLLGRPYGSRPQAQRTPAQQTQRPTPDPCGQGREANTTPPRRSSRTKAKGP